MTIEEQLLETLHALPPAQQAEVLDFAEFLRRRVQPAAEEYESGIAYWSDCSAGCYHFHPLMGKARYDWGVCTNPHAPRAGLLTFEHMGCECYESEWHPMGINHKYNRADATRQSRKPWRHRPRGGR